LRYMRYPLSFFAHLRDEDDDARRSLGRPSSQPDAKLPFPRKQVNNCLEDLQRIGNVESLPVEVLLPDEYADDPSESGDEKDKDKDRDDIMRAPTVHMRGIVVDWALPVSREQYESNAKAAREAAEQAKAHPRRPAIMMTQSGPGMAPVPMPMMPPPGPIGPGPMGPGPMGMHMGPGPGPPMGPGPMIRPPMMTMPGPPAMIGPPGMAPMMAPPLPPMPQPMMDDGAERREPSSDPTPGGMMHPGTQPGMGFGAPPMSSAAPAPPPPPVPFRPKKFVCRVNLPHIIVQTAEDIREEICGEDDSNFAHIRGKAENKVQLHALGGSADGDPFHVLLSAPAIHEIYFRKAKDLLVDLVESVVEGILEDREPPLTEPEQRAILNQVAVMENVVDDMDAPLGPMVSEEPALKRPRLEEPVPSFPGS